MSKKKSRGKAAPRIHKFKAEDLVARQQAKKSKRFKILAGVVGVILYIIFELFVF